ncbi:hypothetical protein BJY00DRAFT_313229 [Aspergillus carlsbadensis]|nr:hypothetical protein BJY00DRAFT_313229 [Aspergillus carlsbadensis]
MDSKMDSKMDPSYTTATTVWPTAVAIPPAVQQLIARFYELADLQSPDAGDRFATEVFTPTGVMAAPGGHGFTGEKEIRNSRKHAWAAVSARRHEVLRVFVADAAGLDFMVLGKVDMTIARSGRTVCGEFTARFVVDEESLRAGEPRLAASTVWADRAPLLAALEG